MKGAKKTTGVIGGFFLLLVSKLKYLVIVLKIAKLHTLLSLLISIGAYSLIYGWKFAVALVYLLFIHEMGHLIAAKQKGLKTTPAVFIPFLGAVIGIKEKPKTIKDDVYISYMGPLAGLLSVIPFYLLYLASHDSFWIVMVQVGSMINLFNLIPMMPLDGGHIARMLSKKLLMAGLLGILTLALFSPDPILVMLLIFGAIQVFSMRKENVEIQKMQWAKEEYANSLLKWEYTIQEYIFLEESEQQAWLNGQIYETKKELNELSYALQQTKDVEKQTRLQAKAESLQIIINQLEGMYDHEPIPKYLQIKLDEINRSIEDKAGYFRTTLKERWLVFGAYLLLILLLSGGMVFSMHTVKMLGIDSFS